MIAFLRALAPAALADGPRAQPVSAPRLATAGAGAGDWAMTAAMTAAATVAPALTEPGAPGIGRPAASARSTPAERSTTPGELDPAESATGQRPPGYRPPMHRPAEPPLAVRPARTGRDERLGSGKPAHETAAVGAAPLTLLPSVRPLSPARASRLDAPIATPLPATERGRTGDSPPHADPAPLRAAASAASALPLADAVVAARVDRASASGSARTIVQVSIDRIDIRAPQASKPTPGPARPGVAGTAALGDWLRGAETGQPARGGRP